MKNDEQPTRKSNQSGSVSSTDILNLNLYYLRIMITTFRISGSLRGTISQVKSSVCSSGPTSLIFNFVSEITSGHEWKFVWRFGKLGIKFDPLWNSASNQSVALNFIRQFYILSTLTISALRHNLGPWNYFKWKNIVTFIIGHKDAWDIGTCYVDPQI